MTEAHTVNPCLSKCMSYKILIYSNRTIRYLIILLELLNALLVYIDSFCGMCLISKNIWYCTSVLPIILVSAFRNLCIVSGSLLKVYYFKMYVIIKFYSWLLYKIVCIHRSTTYKHFTSTVFLVQTCVIS